MAGPGGRALASGSASRRGRARRRRGRSRGPARREVDRALDRVVVDVRRGCRRGCGSREGRRRPRRRRSRSRGSRGRPRAGRRCGRGCGSGGRRGRRRPRGALAIGDRLAELDQAAVDRVVDDRALAAQVVDVAEGDRVEVDEEGAVAVQLLAVGGACSGHALGVALLGAGEDDPDVEVAAGGSASSRSATERTRGDAGGVVVGAGHDLREGDVDQQRERDQPDRGRHQLGDREPARLDAGQPQRRCSEQERHDAGPEDQADRAEAGRGRARGGGWASAHRAGAEHEPVLAAS